MPAAPVEPARPVAPAAPIAPLAPLAPAAPSPLGVAVVLLLHAAPAKRTRAETRSAGPTILALILKCLTRQRPTILANSPINRRHSPANLAKGHSMLRPLTAAFADLLVIEPAK